MHEKDCGCDGRLVNGFCLVLGITLYNIKEERKLTNQSNDKTDKITPSRQTVMSPNAVTLRSKLRSQIKKEKKAKTVFSSSVPQLVVLHEYFVGVISV